jgi:2-polyprenyl-3-methyl-5-hydroxy-6-metoxy-1,4-benzoquinol methylase
VANQNLKDVIKDRYGKIARGEETFCCPSCGPTTTDQCLAVGYTPEELRLVPELAILGVGCGNPTAMADLEVGETVLDLGSGAGIDVFLAAKKVGEQGRVIGVDMTEDMVAKGRQLAQSMASATWSSAWGRSSICPWTRLRWTSSSATASSISLPTSWPVTGKSSGSSSLAAGYSSRTW